MSFIGEIFALSAAFLWSFSSIVFTKAIKRIGITQLNFSRMFIASILLIISIIILNFNLSISFEQFILLSISGLFGLVLGDTFLFKSYNEIGPRVAMLIMSSNPAITSIIAYFIFDEILPYTAIIGMLVTFIGISIVILSKDNDNNTSKFKITRKGIFYAFLAAIGQSSGLVFVKLAINIDDVNSLVVTFYRISTSVVMMIPILFLSKSFTNPIVLFKNDITSLGLVSLGAIIGPFLGITASVYAIVYAELGIASTLMSITPILMIPISYFVFKEKISMFSIIGSFAAVVGVAILFLV